MLTSNPGTTEPLLKGNLHSAGRHIDALFAKQRTLEETIAAERVQVELQLEDKQVRSRTKHLLADISDMRAVLEEVGLITRNDSLDSGFPQIRGRDEPLMNPVQSLSTVLEDISETLHRRLCVWQSLRVHPRMTPERLDRVRKYLNSKACTWSRYRGPGYAQKEHPLVLSPMSWPQIVDRFGLDTARRLGPAAVLRLELASERHLRKLRPEQAEETIQSWWDRRYSPPQAIEDVQHRRDRLRRLLDKYGIRPKVIELSSLPVPQDPFAITPDRPDTLPKRDNAASKDLFESIMNAPAAPHELRVEGQLYPPKLADFSNDPEMRLVSFTPFDVPNRPLNRSPRYVPTFEPDHEEIQELITKIAGLSDCVQCFRPFREIKDARPVTPKATPPETLPSLDVPSPQANPEPTPPVAKEELDLDKLPPLPRMNELPPPPAPGPGPEASTWPSAGESIQLRGNELVLSRTPSGELVLRWETAASAECKKLANEPTVIEISLHGALSSRVEFPRFVEQVCAEFDRGLASKSGSPLTTDLLVSLSSYGQLKTLENIILSPSTDVGIFNLELAPGATLRSVAAESMGVILRLRGSTATCVDVDLLNTTVDLQLSQSTWRNCHFSRMTTLRGSFGAGTFDADCTLQANATEADLRQMDVLGDNLQRRLSGLLYRGKNMNSALIARLKIRNLSHDEWDSERTKRDEAFTSERFISAIRLLEPENHYRPAKTSFKYAAETPTATEESRSRVALKIAPMELLKIYVAPPVDEAPCQLRFETYTKSSGKSPVLVRREPVNGEETQHYHGALYYVLDLVFERAKRLPPRGPARRKLPWFLPDDALQLYLSGVEEVVGE